MHDLRGNGVDAVDGTQGDNVLVGAAAVFNAGGLDGNEDGCSLPYFVVEAGLTQGVDPYFVGFLEDGYLLGGQFAKAPYAQSGTGERMAAEDVRIEAELGAYFADFLLV